jgi:hypothetical protein
MAAQKSRIQQLIEAIKSKRWHDANVLTSRILEGKVMARIAEERKGMFKNGFVKEQDEVEGDGDPKLEKEAFPGAAPKFKKKIAEEDEPGGKEADEPFVKECAKCGPGQKCKCLKEGYYRVTYMDGKKERTLKFQGSAADARAKVKQDAGDGKTIVDVETLSQSEYAEADAE